MAVPIPRYFDEIDREWLSAALSVRHPGIIVDSVEETRRLTGSGAKVFLTLTYQDSTEVPEQVVVKGGFTTRDPDQATAMWERIARWMNVAEARFYRDFAPATRMEVPRCYFAGIDDESGRGAVVLEDLTVERTRFGAFDAPLNVDSAAEVLSTLARLHARYWADPVLDGPALRDPLVEGDGLLFHYITEENWQEKLSRPRGRDIPRPLQDRSRIVEALEAMWSRQFDPPLTAVHGDAHVGNLYFRPGGTAGLLDWQVFSRGIWAADVPYFIVGAMETNLRRGSEADLLQFYLDQLRASGGPEISHHEAWKTYRQRMFHGFLNYLTPVDGIQTEEYNATIGGRFAAAILDLDSFGALGLPS